MGRHSPPHPGEFICEVYLTPYGSSGRALAATIGVAPSTLTRALRGTSAVTPAMEWRGSKSLGRSPESWPALQHRYELWRARQMLALTGIAKSRLTAA